MPELPEVEVTKKALSFALRDTSIIGVNVRNKKLRWPIEENKIKNLIHSDIKKIDRRGKYILVHCEEGALILHLGMSGSIGVFDENIKYHKHDHLELILNNKKVIRLNDPRRFGCAVWTDKKPEEHKLIRNLGIEPLEVSDLGERLYSLSRNRNTVLKKLVSVFLHKT